jgi:GAF domain-containing protein
LSRLAVGEGQHGLEEMLTRVAQYAVAAIPGADGAGLTVMQNGLPDTIVGSADFVRDVDAIQYGLSEGPCITATLEGCTVTSDSSSGAATFPRFWPPVARVGVQSVLSLPLKGSEGVLGSLNVYAHAPNAFDARAVELGELFALPAAVSVQNAQALALVRRLAARLQEALTSRAVVDQAVGISMSRGAHTQEDALAELRAASQSEALKLSEVADQVVSEATRRAQADRGDASGFRER